MSLSVLFFYLKKQIENNCFSEQTCPIFTLRRTFWLWLGPNFESVSGKILSWLTIAVADAIRFLAFLVWAGDIFKVTNIIPFCQLFSLKDICWRCYNRSINVCVVCFLIGTTDSRCRQGSCWEERKRTVSSRMRGHWSPSIVFNT